MRNKNKSKNTLPPPLPSSWAQLHSRLLSLLPPSGAGRRGMGAVVTLTLLLLPPHCLPLPQPGSFPRDAVLEEQTASACVPHGVKSPVSKPALVWAPLTGPQVLPGACSSVGFPRGHSLLQVTTCCDMGWSVGCRWRSAPL